MGILPNYKLRLYAAGALSGRLQKNYTDVSLDSIPTLKKSFHQHYFPAYPEHVPSSVQSRLDKNLGKAIVRAEAPTNCAVHTCIALTFDDGPDPHLTTKVLDTLDTYGIPATFFVQGSQVQRSPDIVKEAHRRGHEIENHTFAHTDLVKLHNPTLIRQQIDETEGALNALGIHAQFLRPPYGSINDQVVATANMPIILWNVDAQEWQPATTAQSLAQSIIAQTRPGAILLMHDTKPMTLDALPTIIEALRDREYRFVTVAQLLQIDGNARGIFAAKL